MRRKIRGCAPTRQLRDALMQHDEAGARTMRVRPEVPMYAIDPSTALTTRSTSAGAVRSSLSGVVILICSGHPGCQAAAAEQCAPSIKAGADEVINEGSAERGSGSRSSRRPSRGSSNAVVRSGRIRWSTLFAQHHETASTSYAHTSMSKPMCCGTRANTSASVGSSSSTVAVHSDGCCCSGRPCSLTL